MRELMEFGILDTNELVHNIVNMAPFPFPKLAELREKYTYNIRPLSSASSSSPSHGTHSSHPFRFVRRGLSLFTSSDEDENSASTDDMDFFYEDQIMATHWNLNTTIAVTRDAQKRSNSPSSPSRSSSKNELVNKNVISLNNRPESPDRSSLDVSLLKKQYARLRERQKQAHLILTEGLRYGYQSAFSQPSSVTSVRERIPIDHLLLGKPALTSSKSKSKPVLVMRSSSLSSTSPTARKDAHAKLKSSSNNKVLVRNKRNVHDGQDDDDVSRRMNPVDGEDAPSAKSQIRVKRRLGAGVRRASSILEQASIPDEDEEDEKGKQETLSWAEIRRRRKISAPSLRSCDMPIRPELRKCESVCLPDTSLPEASSLTSPSCDQVDQGKKEPVTRDTRCSSEQGEDCHSDNNNNVDPLTRVSSTEDEQHVSETSTTTSSTSTATEIGGSESDADLPDSALEQDIDVEAIRLLEVNEKKEEERIILCVKREISDLSIDECLARLNQKISSLKQELKD